MKYTYSKKLRKDGVVRIGRDCTPLEDFKERLNLNRNISQKGYDTPCWEWTGSRNKRGYGSVCFQGKAKRVHRVSWLLNHGEIPQGMEVCHKCDNPSCFNPDHLFIGNHIANMKDASNKGRIVSKKGEDHPMRKLSDDDVREIRRLHSEGRNTYALADDFNVRQGTIWYIVSRTTWRHI